jgi:hypothetical protein
MFWRYSLKDTKLLLNLTLLLFSAFAVFLGRSWNIVSETESNVIANSVGVYASIEENEVNGLLAQLNEKEKELNEREIAIVEKENRNEKETLLWISLIGFGLFGLILLNFYLDFKKRMTPVG